MNTFFKNATAIVVTQMLFQVIGCSEKALSINRSSDDAKVRHSFDISFTEQKVEYRNGMNWTEFHPLEVIYDFVKELNEKYPELTELTTIGETYQKRELKVLRISENPENYKKIWIDGGIHAREWISPATVTYIMHQLLTNWQDQPEYMKKLTWYFMPVVNPDGYVYSWNGDRNWRKNRSPIAISRCIGVDLNRNFDFGWATVGSSPLPCNKSYHGPSAASELETQAVKKFLLKNKRNLESFLTYHSRAQSLIYPWMRKNESTEDVADLQSVAELARERIKAKTGVDYKVVGGSFIGGTSREWSHKDLGVKYVYTVELNDKGHHGFEPPPDQIIPTAQEGFIVANTVAEAVGAQLLLK